MIDVLFIHVPETNRCNMYLITFYTTFTVELIICNSINYGHIVRNLEKKIYDL